VNPGAGRIRLALVANQADCLAAAQRIVAFARGYSPA
jgi:N-succinyldiaminopimelate aminotransferase